MMWHGEAFRLMTKALQLSYSSVMEGIVMLNSI